jgi:hypothetical protein
MDWLIETITISHFEILLYWILLAVPLIAFFVMEVKYCDIKFKHKFLVEFLKEELKKPKIVKSNIINKLKKVCNNGENCKTIYKYE